MHKLASVPDTNILMRKSSETDCTLMINEAVYNNVLKLNLLESILRYHISSQSDDNRYQYIQTTKSGYRSSKSTVQISEQIV